MDGEKDSLRSKTFFFEKKKSINYQDRKRYQCENQLIHLDPFSLCTHLYTYDTVVYFVFPLVYVIIMNEKISFKQAVKSLHIYSQDAIIFFERATHLEPIDCMKVGTWRTLSRTIGYDTSL